MRESVRLYWAQMDVDLPHKMTVKGNIIHLKYYLPVDIESYSVFNIFLPLLCRPALRNWKKYVGFKFWNSFRICRKDFFLCRPASWNTFPWNLFTWILKDDGASGASGAKGTGAGMAALKAKQRLASKGFNLPYLEKTHIFLY